MSGGAKRPPHVTRKFKAIPWLVCRFCGLVFLRNALTEHHIRLGCDR
jgi:hypothetical protein